MTKATLRDVARLAEVHYTTVSRALNPDTAHLVNGRTLRRVLAAAEEIGYRPNVIARSLRTRRTSMIGVLVSDISSSIVGGITLGIEDVLVPAGFLTLVLNASEVDDDASRVEALMSRGVDGLIVSAARTNSSIYQDIATSGVPVVLANRRLADGSLSSVTSDDAAGVSAAVDHLVHLGHSRIVHLRGPRDTSTARSRETGFREAMHRHGIEATASLSEPVHSYTSEEGRRVMLSVLDGPFPPTAVVAANDSVAVGCYDALRERGLRCPEDVSVVGFNNIPLVDKLSPPLTTVSVPHRQIGQESARILLEQLENPVTGPKSVLLPVSLVVRQSTAAPAES